MDEATETIGIIFPLLPEHLRRFFEDGKTVFVKFLGVKSTLVRLHVGFKLFFYQSRRNMEIVGEADIVGIDSGTFEEVWNKYGNALFLSHNELERYVSNEKYAIDRKAKKMFILVVDRAKKYPKPLSFGRSLTMTGQYMTRQMYDELKKQPNT